MVISGILCVFSVCNVQVLYMWGDDADPKTQILHMSWSVGAILVPLVVSPFLVERPEDTENNVTTIATNYNTNNDGLDFEIPYLIIGSMCVVVGVIALVMYIRKPPQGNEEHLKPKQSIKEIFAPLSFKTESGCFTIQMLILCALLLFAIVGREYTFNTWIFTYAYESDLEFTKQEAALLTSANKICFTLGMVFSATASKFITPPPILFTTAIAGLLVSIALLIWGTKYRLALWILSCILNLFQGPLWPTSILYTDKFIEVSALILGVMYAGGGIAAVIFHWLTGYLFTDPESADSFMYIIVSCAVLFCIILSVMQFVGMKRGPRYKSEKEEEKGDMDIAIKGGQFEPSSTNL